MSGQIPAWGYVIGAIMFNAALLIGMWIGWGRGWAHCEEEQRQAVRDDADAVQAWLQYVGQPLPPPTEVAHEAWLAHADQAMALASDQPVLYDRRRPRDAREDPGLIGKILRDEQPDPRTDTQWTRDMAADMTEFLAGLLDQHPAMEEDL